MRNFGELIWNYPIIIMTIPSRELTPYAAHTSQGGHAGANAIIICGTHLSRGSILVPRPFFTRYTRRGSCW